MKKFISAFVGIASAVSMCATGVNAQPQLDTAISGEYEISENKVIPQIGTKFSDLNVWGSALLRVFEDDTKAVQLTANDTLSNGNCIELEENGVFDYYTVYSNVREVFFTAKDAAEMGAIARGNATDANGIGGKPEDDSSVLLTSTGADGSASVYSVYKNHEIGQITDGTWSHENAEGYLVFEAGIFPGDTTEFKLCTNGSRSFFGGSGVIALNPGEWNKVMVVYDFKNKVAKRIVNGEESEWTAPTFGTNNYNVFRVWFEGQPGKTSAYLDDYKIYAANDIPEYKAQPVLDDSVYRIEGSTFITNAALTVGDITCEGAKVRVFTDKTYEVALEPGDSLATGNVIAVTGADGGVTYYDVCTEEEIELMSWWTLNPVDVTSSTVKTVTNAGSGKDAYDAVLKYNNECYIRLNTTTNLSSDKMLPAPLTDMTKYSGYMVVSMNVMSPVETQKVSITTNSGNIIMGNNAGGAVNVNSAYGFTANRWNSVVCLIRLENGSTTALQTTYVNGVQIAERAHNLFSSGKTDVRLNATGSGEMYIDDVKIKFTTEEPDISSITAMPTLEDIEGKAYVEGNEFVITADVTAGEISAASGVVRVFESETFEAELDSEDVLSSGNIIMVTDAMGKIGYYVVS